MSSSTQLQLHLTNAMSSWRLISQFEFASSCYSCIHPFSYVEPGLRLASQTQKMSYHGKPHSAVEIPLVMSNSSSLSSIQHVKSDIHFGIRPHLTCQARHSISLLCATLSCNKSCHVWLLPKCHLSIQRCRTHLAHLSSLRSSPA